MFHVHQKIHKVSTLFHPIIVRYGAAVLAFGVISPLTARAQFDEDAFKKALEEQLTKGMERGLLAAIQAKVPITPAVVNVDSISQTATLTFVNPTKDTLEARISVGTTPPAGPFGDASPRKAKATSPLLDDAQDSNSITPMPDSVDADRSLASWIVDLPDKLKLAPGEKKTITVKLQVPPGTKPGEYAAWVITSTAAEIKYIGGENDVAKVQKLEKKVNGATGFVNQAGAKLIYRHRSSQ